METLGDLVARDRRSDAPALLAGDREMDYRRFCTTAWKASNYLRHLGVAGDRGIVALEAPSPPPLLTFFGAALLDVPTRFVADASCLGSVLEATNARAVLVPRDSARALDPPPGVTVSVHGDDPERPDVDHWESGVWSENPAFVPSPATPASVALSTGAATVSHGQLLDAGRRVVDRLELTKSTTVGVADGCSLADPRTIAAGVVAPLLVGASFRLGPGDSTVTVGVGDAADLTLDAVAVDRDS